MHISLNRGWASSIYRQNDDISKWRKRMLSRHFLTGSVFLYQRPHTKPFYFEFFRVRISQIWFDDSMKDLKGGCVIYIDQGCVIAGAYRRWLRKFLLRKNYLVVFIRMETLVSAETETVTGIIIPGMRFQK